MNEFHKPATAREVAERISAGMLTKETPDVFAENGAYITPFALPGAPARIEGRTAIMEHMQAVASSEAASALELQEVIPTFHEGKDPEVVVMQFKVKGKSRVTGEAFELDSSIGVLRVRGGKIVEWHDYPNIIGGAAASGTLGRLAAMLAQVG
ncbi:nuclear transport factor 2 family protein [Streptomyces platensis]|uniref:nuclear transport factor 2 family protein n=1 Tax=Streptomyces platensis TaxID=58346 RepID=UPI002E25C342|nr:nuclear transport factor 2 family protein [Streptomyces platensis]